MSLRPLAIDLFCGLGGWAEGLLAEGYDIIGFDIERHVYGAHRYPAHLVIQDVLTLHGCQFRDAALIVASPPCQEYSYMAMPWSRAKAKAAAIRADTTGKMLVDLNRLFDACFRIQAQASMAAGRHIPMVVENVRGAQPWVGRARWNFGSFYLWGDVPALMPFTGVRKLSPHLHLGGGNSFAAYGREAARHDPRHTERREREAIKTFGHSNQRDGHDHTRHLTNPGEHGRKAPESTQWFNDGPRTPESLASSGSKSPQRKAASAMIAKIPLPLSRHIAATFRP